MTIVSLRDIPEGDFKSERPVYIKNNTEHPIKLVCKLTKSSDYVSCIFYPGWNPELVVEIKDVPINSLQKGY